MKALVTLKVCRECRAKAPIGQVIEHKEACSGSPNLCDAEQGYVELSPGAEVVRIET